MQLHPLQHLIIQTNSMMHISIPKPCHEDWNEMIPNQQGRHCNVCCKTVVDFTSMNDEEVKFFFLNKKKDESVCGRFKTEQLQRIKIQLPSNIYTISMPLWKRFLTACLLAFSSMLFSCDALVGNHTMGESYDETKTERGIVGALEIRDAQHIQEDTLPKASCSTIIGDSVSVESIAQGEISIAPVEPAIVPEEVLPAIEEPKSLQTILTGKVAIDTGSIATPDSIDTAKPVKKQSDCGNDFITL